MAVQSSIRYRGYVYDTETGLYYLQSRYYDPETGRFLNADDVDFFGVSGTVLSFNAFDYCENNAVKYCDEFGFVKSIAIKISKKFLPLMYLEGFLNKFLAGTNNIKYSKLRELYNCLYYIEVEYTDTQSSKAKKLKITFGGQERWYKSTKLINNISPTTLLVFEEFVSTPYLEEDDFHEQKAKLPGMCVLLFMDFKRMDNNKDKYNRVWGKSGIDSNNSQALYLFVVKSKKESLYAYSLKKGDIMFV